MSKSLYQILEVPLTSSTEEIKRAYRTLSKKYHPDLNSNTNASFKFQEVNNAYTILSNSKSRNEYDKSLNKTEKSLNITVSVTIPFEFSITGGLYKINVNHQMKEVNIPAGIKHGSKLRVAGQGNRSYSKFGDLYLIISVEPSPVYKLVGDDIYKEQSIPLKTAMFGGVLEIEFFSEIFDLNVPENLGNGKHLVINGRGSKNLSTMKHGDLILVLNVEIPNVKYLNKFLVFVCKRLL